MILKKEIEVKAETQNIPKSTIDKDWVLGHFIDAIFSIPECKESLIFKGGTCLRKCYFPNYRFSEDLDFTCTNPKFELTKKMLNQLVQILTERTEIPLHIEELKPLLHKDKLMGYKALIKFWGADHPRNQAPPPPERWTTSINPKNSYKIWIKGCKVLFLKLLNRKTNTFNAPNYEYQKYNILSRQKRSFSRFFSTRNQFGWCVGIFGKIGAQARVIEKC